ncbi:ribosome biogenesis protein BRX1 homolog [Penaeus vannamei]|uniref:Ribosome biogenesis protein BRX1 homolog n=1 Tax=Penaeus vannamei TaxID=6689 RepID=A0A423SR02_PENVA|nr:ribosome biogenesis protein BRX1 homolog [Penaeus vannamei]ROT66636.1 putative ribosome biogenesis protein BRX1-like [Penaeus vannamei]
MAKKRARKAVEEEEEEVQTPAAPTGFTPPLTRDSDVPVTKKLKKKWTNKQRVLVFGSRGIGYRERHLMENLRTLMPHSRREVKKQKRDDLRVINEIAEMKNCNKCIYFEMKKKKDFYMWISQVPNGPSIKFLVLNIHTMGELKMTGNCLRGARPLLSFDPQFNEPHWAIMKELFIQTFGIPNYHPRSQPFHDHVYTFTIVDDKIWFRNYEILGADGKLSEIGPRFVLNPIKVFAGSFGGETLWQNPNYMSPNLMRSLVKKNMMGKYLQRRQQKDWNAKRGPAGMIGDPTNEIFQTEANDD